MDYTHITFNDLFSNFLSRLSSDKRFKNIGSATVFGMFLEMLTASTDMANFNLQRMLEECFFRTARLDSSHIKLCKNLGYNPRRPVPAQAELSIVLKGPFPAAFKTTKNEVTIGISNDVLDLSFLNFPYRLQNSFTYTMTQADKDHCTASDWRLTLRSAIKNKSVGNGIANDQRRHYQLQRPEAIGVNDLPIKCYQGELKTVVFKGESYLDKFGQDGQYFDIDDITFSNWYGERDPIAKNDAGNYSPLTATTRVIVSHLENYAFGDHYFAERFSPVTTLHGTKMDTLTEYDIQDDSIFLNESILDARGANADGTSIPAVCQIESNPDKTVRISFSGLKSKVQPGLQYVKLANGNIVPQNLIVRYLSTAGAFANKIGVKKAILSNKKRIYMYVDGKSYDITNNIEFELKSDILGGQNFESQNEMYNNAEAYFASMMKLVSKRDFINYFSDLTRPIHVNTALVYGIKDLDNSYEKYIFNPSSENNKVNILPISQNYIFYTLANSMYTKTEDYKHIQPANILMSHEHANGRFDWNYDGFNAEDPNDTCTLYCDKYTDHIIDYLKFLVSPQAYYNDMAINVETEESDQYVKNIKYINNDIIRMIPTNTIVYSLPPFMHYFDVVGDIKVKSLTVDLDKYKERITTKVYEYLKNTANESREIYKSNLTKVVLDDPDTAVADLNIKVSELISPIFKQLEWNRSDCEKGVRLLFNKDILTYKQRIEYQNTNRIVFNEIVIPKRDSNYVPLSGDAFHGNIVTIDNLDFIIYGDKYGSPATVIPEPNTKAPSVQCKLTEYDDFIKIALLEPYTIIITEPGNILELYDLEDADDTSKYNEETNKYAAGSYTATMLNYTIDSFKTTITTNDNYWTSSKFELTEERAKDYGLSLEQLTDVRDYVNEWIDNLLIHDQADRAIDLPYNVYSFTKDYITRKESIIRYGDLIGEIEKTLSEKSFWEYLSVNILKKFYQDKITETTSLTSIEWANATKLIMDLYKLLKPGITDSILDDNNNIVNYSMDQDIAVIRFCPNISYINE